jgi:selenoprotein W-related protein
LAAEIKKHRPVDVELHRGSGGQFEVRYDGRLLFSKKEVGRFPDAEEILSQIPA